jgi:hypothetical protein
VKVDGRAFGIADARIRIQSSLLALLRQGYRGIDRQIPRMVQVHVRAVACQHVGIGQSRAVIFGGIAGDRQGGIHRVAHRPGREIRGAGIAALLADIDGDAETFVTVVFDGFHCALAHRDTLSESFGNVD